MSPRRRFFYALKKFDEDYHGQIKEIFAVHVRKEREVALNAHKNSYNGSFTVPVVAPAIPLVAPVVGSTVEVIGLGIAGIVTLFSLGKKIKDYNSQSQIHADSKPKILGTPIHEESGPKVLSTPIEAEHGPKVNSTPIHENDRVDEGYDIYDGPSSSTFTTPIPDDINKPSILAKVVDGKKNNTKQKERIINDDISNSLFWNKLKPYRGNIKTNGLKGSKKRYYQKDRLHNEIEVYNHNGEPLPPVDPETGVQLNKSVKKHKNLRL